MKATVNKEACIGCGACQAITQNEYFEIENDGLAGVKEELKEKEVPEEFTEMVQDAADSCPTSAIEIQEDPEN